MEGGGTGARVEAVIGRMLAGDIRISSPRLRCAATLRETETEPDRDRETDEGKAWGGRVLCICFCYELPLDKFHSDR